MKRCVIALAFLPIATGAPGCGPAKVVAVDKPPPPATVAKVAKEDELGTVVLKPEAEARLGMVCVAAERKPVGRARLYAGDVIVPPGRLITVSSPYAATVMAAGDAPTPGMAVKKGQPVVAILPLLSAEARANMATLRLEADGQVDQARKQLSVAKVALDRVVSLRSGTAAVGAGAVEDAKAQFGLAEGVLQTAEERRNLLARTLQEAGAGSMTPLPLNSPEDGILRNSQTGSGQQVAPGAVLFEVERLDPIWVRVPVYVGDLKGIAPGKEARVGALGDRPAEGQAVARPVAAPPSGDPLSATVDLFYEMPNPGLALRPGQRMGVTVPLVGEPEGLVVPSSALYYDIQGGAWVYEQVKDHTFARRRVEVEQVDGASAVLARGIRPGVKVAAVGVAELFGTEFGFSK